MSTAIKRRRGTTTQHNSFTGLSAELTVDTTKNTVVVHDGSTAGGHPLAKEASTVALTGNQTVAGTKTFSSNPVLDAGTANGVLYLNTSKVATSGSALTFDGTNLAVGTTTYSTIGGSLATLSLGGTNPNVSGGIAYQVNGTVKAYQYVDTGGIFTHQTLSGVNQAFFANGSEQMRLTSTGLGIGTSSPSTKLHVAGTVVSNQGVMKIQDLGGSGTSAYPVISLYDAGGTHQGDLGMFAGDQVVSNLTASGKILFKTNSTTVGTFDSSGNLGLGVTPSAWVIGGSASALQVKNASFYGDGSSGIYSSNTFFSSSWKYISAAAASQYEQSGGAHKWYTAPSGTAGNAISFTQPMTLDSSGNLLVGTTSQITGEKFAADTTGASAKAITARNNAGSGAATIFVWNSATSGDNLFIGFGTEDNGSQRGSISYNRTGGLTAYNTTSDYRAKDIIGPVQNSGALIDSVPVYMGKMKGATQERPMFIAHETPAYAHTGEKDAVNADGNPVYQQMDASALIPVMWAEIQSLRARVAALES
jgi:hypothetical protein